MRVLMLALLLVGLTQVIQVEGIFGLAGLVALKAGAIGYALGRGGRRGRRRGYGHGYGGGYKRGYGHGGHYRYGRDLAEQQEVEEERHHLAVEAAQMDSYFSAVMLGDEDRCSMRLVCELHSMDASRLGEDANMILALFGNDVPSSGRPDSPKRMYDAAAEVGRTGTVETCAETFHQCQYGAEELLDAMHDPLQQ